jgi:AcrR family transcriptional regulator
VLSSGRVSTGRRNGAQVGSILSRRGDVLVSQTQRARMLNSAVQAIAEVGYGELSISRITSGAGVSRRTFYDLFADREDCFLAAFEEAVLGVRELLLEHWGEEADWRAQIRGALLGMLLFLDREPAVRSMLILDTLKAGSRVQRRRAEVLSELSGVLHASGCRAAGVSELPALTGEGVIGAVLGVIHTRLLAKSPGQMVDLLNPLMGVIVLPYLGPAAAQAELLEPVPRIAHARTTNTRGRAHQSNHLLGLPIRITHRTLLVLRAIGETPDASNREIADQAGIADQGQISKLLSRLRSLGLIENTGPEQPAGTANRWRLTARGEQVQQALQTETHSHTSQRRTLPA